MRSDSGVVSVRRCAQSDDDRLDEVAQPGAVDVLGDRVHEEQADDVAQASRGNGGAAPHAGENGFPLARTQPRGTSPAVRRVPVEGAGRGEGDGPGKSGGGREGA